MVLTTKAIETSLDKLVKEFSGEIGVITENNVGLNVGLNVALCNKFNETLKLEIYQEDNKVLFKAPLAYYGEFNADDIKFFEATCVEDWHIFKNCLSFKVSVKDEQEFEVVTREAMKRYF